jgi:hypothetical protein
LGRGEGKRVGAKREGEEKIKKRKRKGKRNQ